MPSLIDIFGANKAYVVLYDQSFGSFLSNFVSQMPFSPTYSWKCVKKRGKSWLSFPPLTKNAPRLSLRRTIFAQVCRWDTTFTLFSRIFTKMWVKTYIYLTKSPKNRTKNFDQTMQQNVVQSAGVNAQFHEFSHFSRICRKKVSILSKNVITQYLTFWTSKIFNSTPIVY